MLTQQTKGMKSRCLVNFDFVVEAVGSPGATEEGYRDGLAELVQLKAASCHSVHDRGVVDRLHYNASLSRSSHQQVDVSSGSGEQH